MIGSIYTTSDNFKYAIIIGQDDTRLYLLEATIKDTLPSGGHILDVQDSDLDAYISKNELKFSHIIDVNGWLEFKRKQLYSLIKN